MLREKIKDFFELVVSIILDACAILVFGLVLVGVKYALENWIFHQKIDTIDNKAFQVIYSISKGFLISIFFVYVACDVIEVIVKFVKRIKKKDD